MEPDATSPLSEVLTPSDYVPISAIQYPEPHRGHDETTAANDDSFGLSVRHLAEMGFDAVAARRELNACNGDIDVAISNLLQA